MLKNASVAQSVEQGTENPRVGGSIPPGGTKKTAPSIWMGLSFLHGGIERRLLETIQWIVSTAVALPQQSDSARRHYFVRVITDIFCNGITDSGIEAVAL